VQVAGSSFRRHPKQIINVHSGYSPGVLLGLMLLP
jgi:hypothetical protein